MFSIIVACDQKNGIGKNGTLPWSIKGDMKHFSETTKNTTSENNKNVVIMGRKTFESIPLKFRPLPKRHNVVITKNLNYDAKNDNVIIAHDFDEALEKAYNLSNYEKIFVIGGAQIYKEAFSHKQLKDVFLTKIKNDFSCDTFIDFNIETMKQIKKQNFKENNIEFEIFQYRNINYF